MEKHSYNGTLVAFEGIDGSGKSTLATSVAGHAGAIQTSEPTKGSYWGHLARRELCAAANPERLAVWFALDRVDHTAQLIRPALQAGELVVVDRYVLSSLVYQGAAGVADCMIRELNAGVIVPDLTIILDLPAEDAMARVGARGEADAMETLENLRACRERYIRFSKEQPSLVLDARNAPHVVFQQAVNEIDAVLASRKVLP